MHIRIQIHLSLWWWLFLPVSISFKIVYDCWLDAWFAITAAITTSCYYLKIGRRPFVVRASSLLKIRRKFHNWCPRCTWFKAVVYAFQGYMQYKILIIKYVPEKCHKAIWNTGSLFIKIFSKPNIVMDILLCRVAFLLVWRTFFIELQKYCLWILTVISPPNSQLY